ncbi:probable DNA mismatch repair protein Msh6 [Bradysia coprophila]|uniref:probable DNA mismatch repair protein Msh6 n=1 Tax=Bradysia coprophila TaxID=38358 RepID=UPI00187DABC9|nr:probable DNA mismatch repair protein Msh6 [Bradysia coprophila]
MSKRNSLGNTSGSNTLFKYFARSPAASPQTPQQNRNTSVSNGDGATPKSSLNKDKSTEQKVQSNKKEAVDERQDDDESPIRPVKPKRLKLIDSDSESDRENECDNVPSVETVPPKKAARSATSAPSTPQPKKKMKMEPKEPMTFEEKLKAMEVQDVDDVVEDIFDEPVEYMHNNLEFLKPENIKDINGHKKSDPEYDPRTLYVPKSFLDKLTPTTRQWWDMKSRAMDCVLFFKIGKFYELYHMDADVGVTELGFTYMKAMKGEAAHSGFPEQSYDRMVTTLVAKGYKVARIEQTETPEMNAERVKTTPRATKFEKGLRREICQVTNRGTQVFSQQVGVTNNYEPNYMLAVCEKHTLTSNRFGVCFIDTSLGEFNIGEFDDDKHCSRLLTLLSHNLPVFILYERNGLSARTSQIFKSMLNKTQKEQLLPGTQFLAADKTLKMMAEKYYKVDNQIVWPEEIKALQCDSDHLGLTPKPSHSLALRSIGACLWYLSQCLIDEQIVSLGRYTTYIPPDNMTSDSVENLERSLNRTISSKMTNRHMVLDSITLSNLKLTEESHSLLNTLDHCCTKFGKRMLKNWIYNPSCEKGVIIDRQDAIKHLMDDDDLLNEAKTILGQLPDLDRLLNQIHAFGNVKRSKDHPDGRAVFFEQKSYNKNKIRDFIAVLDGFDALTKLPAMFKNCKSKYLRTLTQCSPNGNFPDIREALKVFKTGFDHNDALEKGVIAPGAGVDREFDYVNREIASINNELQAYLKKQEKYFGCRLSYSGTDKKRFQIEVPEKCCHLVDKSDIEYTLEGQKKGFKRYHTEDLKDMLKRMIETEEQRNAILKDLSRRMFEKFSNEYQQWKKCVDLAATLDVLLSMATYGNTQGHLCFPDIVDGADGPILEMEDGYHPCMKLTDDFIPNGITLGGSSPPLALLTGPNMGGKSTLMRQVAILVIMTQMGCPIPATSCRMTLVDRIFTRLGAQDDIMAGHSTFLVELSETSSILKHATLSSLVLLDELGRGTATYDGTAIAASVVNFLADLKCRTLFSTHYHNLVDNFHKDNRVSLGHMACMVENENDDDPTQETVTFLYKYSDGACPKSYGFNAAKLAGMPNGVIKRAHELSKKVEAEALKRKLVSKIMVANGASIAEIRDILTKLKTLVV